MNRDSAKKPPASRLRARLREATTDAIRSAAEEVFAEQGFGARMEDIAARAGVSVGTLYNHFEDRDALLLVLIQARREALLAQVDQVLAEVEGRPVRDQLRALLDEVFGHFHEHARFFAIVVQSEVFRGSGYPQRAGTLVELTKRVEQLLQRGVAAGQLRSEGSEFYATLLLGMVRSVLMRAVETKQIDDLLRGADTLLRVFLRGIEV
ncbi:TetR/AcrR family transcriptional regulator [Archangium lipolyticum]|uniref:TetR/AcrR family transcriptional regulator n=1 Tax=Archangium lipolyticum TaxID=2970465 RepID=UPI0027D45551|nr:TetR/AcrR family transcriptional regulator [Archangium lipolyticum]